MDGILLFVLLVAAALFALHRYRQYWTYRDLPQLHSAPFEGELFSVGSTYIARRSTPSGTAKTVVCFPGFLEDMRYFQALYDAIDCELILVNNADYHNSFPALTDTPLNWPDNPYPMGSIEHDGFYLGLAVQELARGEEVIVHGHSRGGAVTLEAGRQYPQLMGEAGRNVRAILEAPVLPKARVVGRGSEPLPHKLICYFMPIVLGLSRQASESWLLRQPMMRPTNALKTQLCLSVYSNARRYSTCVANVRSINRWQRETSHDIYRHYPEIRVVMGERDDVLDNDSMLESAQAGAGLNPALLVVPTDATNHFPSLEAPHYLHALLARD